MIRKATINDLNSILYLLKQISEFHTNLRPDLFKPNTKYTKEELIDLINSDDFIIFLYEENNEILGYVFLKLICIKNQRLLNDIKTIYIDDFCVDETKRGKGIGRILYNYVKAYAKENNYNNITLNVWSGNDAIKFYEKIGLKPQKITLEEKL